MCERVRVCVCERERQTDRQTRPVQSVTVKKITPQDTGVFGDGQDSNLPFETDRPFYAHDRRETSLSADTSCASEAQSVCCVPIQIDQFTSIRHLQEVAFNFPQRINVSWPKQLHFIPARTNRILVPNPTAKPPEVIDNVIFAHFTLLQCSNSRFHL